MRNQTWRGNGWIWASAMVGHLVNPDVFSPKIYKTQYFQRDKQQMNQMLRALYQKQICGIRQFWMTSDLHFIAGKKNHEFLVINVSYSLHIVTFSSSCNFEFEIKRNITEVSFGLLMLWYNFPTVYIKRWLTLYV